MNIRNIFPNKKGSDTRAINLLVSILIIGLVIGIVYLWLTTQVLGRQKESISGSLGSFGVDQAISSLMRGSVPYKNSQMSAYNAVKFAQTTPEIAGQFGK